MTCDDIMGDDIIRGGMRMHRGSWVMVSSLSHIKNLSICHKGITDFKKLRTNMKQMLRRQNSAAMFLTRVSPASPLDVSGGRIRMNRTRLIVGLITHIVIYLTITKRPDLGCSAIDNDEEIKKYYCRLHTHTPPNFMKIHSSVPEFLYGQNCST
jgi:hypothetical protein